MIFTIAYIYIYASIRKRLVSYQQSYRDVKSSMWKVQLLDILDQSQRL